ncbi:MAG: NfeD family protein [Rubripirellula sp.]|jgi:membrane-bound serine protease (ClpP class)|nr:NfeD family protein [Rubripirellula sp.]
MTIKLLNQTKTPMRWWICLFLAVSNLTWLLPVQAQVIRREGRERSAVIIPLKEDINPLSGALLKRKFEDAVDSGVDVIILDINSPGGFTYVTFELMDMVLEAKEVETVAFIEKDAISGAALLSLACDQIIMLPGARMGDAGEIVMGADGAYRYTEAKSRSVLAQKARDTAAATGRPLALAEKLVDKDMVVFAATNQANGETRYFSDKEWESFKDADQWVKGKPVREAGKEMFFIANGQRAVELGMASQTIKNRSELAATLNVSEPIPVMERTWIDSMVFLLNTGVVTFLLIVIGLIALTIELGAPGMGVGGLVSLLCFSLFFWSRFLGGTSGWLEVTLFLVGLVFIGAELFVIPGFGVSGVGGITLVIGSLVMASRRFIMPQSGEQWTGLGYDILLVVSAFMGFLIALIFLSKFIGDIPGLSRLTLKPPVIAEGAVAGVAVSASEILPGWQRAEVGDVGQTVSPLRPSGKIQIDDFMVDVVTEGEFVEPDIKVKVIGKQGARIIVRPA